jgi:hypothetical protein
MAIKFTLVRMAALGISIPYINFDRLNTLMQKQVITSDLMRGVPTRQILTPSMDTVLNIGTATLGLPKVKLS